MVDPKVERILDAVLTHAEKVIDIDCFYVALYNRVTVNLDFPLTVRKTREGLEKLETGKGRWASRPYQPGKSLPDYIFAYDQAVLIDEEFEDWIEKKNLNYHEGEFPRSWLGVPLTARGRAIGAIVVESYRREHTYDARTLVILSAMANRAAGSLANARLVESLRAVNQIGQKLTSGIRLSINDILELIYQQASQLMDTRDMYIALYDAGQQRLSFLLAMLDGKRENWPSRQVDIEDETKGGLTEEVIRTKKPLCPQNVEEWYKKKDFISLKPVPKSWLGVPMMVEDRVLGVIALANDEVENLYGVDDQEVLQTMAGQAAVAIQNAKLLRDLREEQKKNIAAGRLTAVNAVAAGFVHRMNNVAGTIPVRVEQIRELLDPIDPKYSKITHYLNAITEDSGGILSAAKAIRSSDLDKETLELADVDTLVSSAVQRIAVPPGMAVHDRCEENLPQVLVFSGPFIDVLENIIRNGLEAINGPGSVTIVGRKVAEESHEWVAIEVEDTGCGIPPEDLPKVFELFFSTKGGMGFALWRAKTLIESLGGRISVSSNIDRGTTFTILLLVA